MDLDSLESELRSRFGNAKAVALECDEIIETAKRRRQEATEEMLRAQGGFSVIKQLKEPTEELDSKAP